MILRKTFLLNPACLQKLQLQDRHTHHPPTSKVKRAVTLDKKEQRHCNQERERNKVVVVSCAVLLLTDLKKDKIKRIIIM